MHIEHHDREGEQARLARTLVDSLGLEGAVFACRANGWDGVLAHLLTPGEDLDTIDRPGLAYHI